MPKTHPGLFHITCALAIFWIGCHLMTAGYAGDKKTGDSKTICVPRDKPTIQSAVDAARDGDTVIVAPGIYKERIVIKKKSITLASAFSETGESDAIAKTVLEGATQAGRERSQSAGPVIVVAPGGGSATKIIGFTIRNGSDGINCSGRIEALHCRFLGNGDGIDFENCGGVCRHNTFEGNIDDAVDLDGAADVLIEDNLIRDNGNDGIEIRFHPYQGPTLNIVIRRNEISGNKEDGIQLIDYPGESDRVIRIERNLIHGNAMSGIGCMSDGNTVENYEGADIPERIYVVNNTIVANHYGVTGGDNLIAANNVFSRNAMSALKNVDGQSFVSHTLFWRNGRDYETSNLDEERIYRENPGLDDSFRPLPQSACIDRGTARLARRRTVLIELPPDFYRGSAPDMGAFEHEP